MKQGRKAQKFISPHWWISVIWRMPNWRQGTKNTRVELYSEATLWKTIQALTQYSLKKDLQRHKWRQQKSWISYPDCRVPGCAGQAADAVSAETQVKKEDAHKLLKISKSECPNIWIRLPRHKWPKSWCSMEDPVVPLERNLYGHPLARLLCKRQLEEALLELGWEKNSELGMYVRSSDTRFFSVSFCDINMTGKKQSMAPMWKKLMKNVDVGEPISFFVTMQTRDVLNVNAKQKKQLLNKKNKMFEPRISAGATEKLPGWKKPHAKTVEWSYDMEGNAQKCKQIHFTRHFSHAVCTLHYMHITLHDSRRATQCVCVRASFHLHFIHDVCLIVRWLSVSSCLSFSCFSPSFTSSLPHSTCTLPGTPSPMSMTPRVETAAHPHNEESCPMARNHPLTGMSPTSSTTSTTQRLFCDDLPGWIRWHGYGALVLVWCRTRRRDHRKSATFTTVYSGARGTSEPETSLSLSWRKVCCQLSPFSHTLVRRDPFANLVRTKNENQVVKWKTKESGFSLKDKGQILAEVRTEIQKHEFEADSDKRSI